MKIIALCLWYAMTVLLLWHSQRCVKTNRHLVAKDWISTKYYVLERIEGKTNASGPLWGKSTRSNQWTGNSLHQGSVREANGSCWSDKIMCGCVVFNLDISSEHFFFCTNIFHRCSLYTFYDMLNGTGHCCCIGIFALNVLDFYMFPESYIIL